MTTKELFERIGATGNDYYSPVRMRERGEALRQYQVYGLVQVYPHNGGPFRMCYRLTRADKDGRPKGASYYCADTFAPVRGTVSPI